MDEFIKKVVDAVVGKETPEPMRPIDDPVMPPPGVRARADGPLSRKLILGHSVWRTLRDWMVEDNRHVLAVNPVSNVVTYARPRSGKATALIITNLLNFAGSVIVLDPKGELAFGTADWRRRVFGQDVFVIDPKGLVERHYHAEWERKDPGRFARDETIVAAGCNPFDGLDADEPAFDSLVQSMAAGISPITDAAKPFFPGNAQTWFQLVTHAVCSGYVGERTPTGRFVPHAATLQAVRIAIEKGAAGLHEIAEYVATVDPEFGRRMAGLMTGSKDSMADIIATVRLATRFIDNRVILEALLPAPGKRMFDLASVRDPAKRFTVYLVVPLNDFTIMAPYLRMMLQRILYEALEVVRTEKLLVILDELGSLGKLELLPSAFSGGSGYGLCCWGFWQNIAQMRAHYGQEAGTFEGSSSVTQFFKVDFETAKYAAERAGRHERLRTSSTRSGSTTSGAQGSSTSSWSHSEQWTVEQLYDGAEIEQMTERVIANFIGEEREGRLVLSAPADYFLLPAFDGRWRPRPDKPVRRAPERPAMTTHQFAAWRRQFIS